MKRYLYKKLFFKKKNTHTPLMEVLFLPKVRWMLIFYLLKKPFCTREKFAPANVPFAVAKPSISCVRAVFLVS